MDAADLLSNSGGYGLTEEEKKRALKWGLLNMGVGILANNSGNYGALAPAIGKGAQQGLLGYQAQIGREEQGAAQRTQRAAQQKLFQDSMMQPTQTGIDGQPQQQPQFDRQRFLNSAMQNPDAGYTDIALKTMLEKGSSIEPKLVTVYENGQPIQKWVKPGEATGVQIGQGKPEDDPQKMAFIQMMREGGIDSKSQQGQKLINEWLTKQATHPAAPSASASVAGITLSTEKKYGEQFAGKIAESDTGLRDAALKAPDLAERSNRIKQVLGTGKVITGFGADTRLQLGKAMGLVGVNDKETIANTEALSADLARNTLDAIKASGLGSGNGFSNADRDFLNKAAGGLISFDSETLKRLADLSYRTAQQSSIKWKNRVKQIPTSALEGTGVGNESVDVPPLYGSSSAPSESFKMLPNASQYSGKRITDTVTNKKYRSNGSKWVEEK
jgi:hypothetical protein